MQVRYQAALRPEATDYSSGRSRGAGKRRAENLIVHEVDGEFVLLDVETDRIHRLNATASAIWRKLGDTVDVEDIARSLLDEFDVDWRVALKDVRDTVDELGRLSLIVVDSNDRAPTEEGDGSAVRR